MVDRKSPIETRTQAQEVAIDALRVLTAWDRNPYDEEDVELAHRLAADALKFLDGFRPDNDADPIQRLRELVD